MDTFLVILTMIMRIICLAILVCDAWAMKKKSMMRKTWKVWFIGVS